MKTWGPTSDVLGQNLYVNDDSFMIKFYSPNTNSYRDPKRDRT